MTAPSSATGSDLCRGCGLCCRGWIFADMAVTPEESARVANSPAIVEKPDGPVWPQPCAFYDGAACACYADRPESCRSYDCLTLAAWRRGDISFDDAREGIDEALAAASALETELVAGGWMQPGEGAAVALPGFFAAARAAADAGEFLRAHGAALLVAARYKEIITRRVSPVSPGGISPSPGTPSRAR